MEVIVWGNWQDMWREEVIFDIVDGFVTKKVWDIVDVRSKWIEL